MRKKARITPFAKIVIAGIIFLGLRYLYIHKDDILSGEFFNFNDSTKNYTDTTDTVRLKDTFTVIPDTLVNRFSDSVSITEDTLTINIEKNEDLLILKSNDFKINILLNDSVQHSDTIFFKLSEEKNITGRIILK